ncbi:hypothetical protein [Streptomyces sp900116325]|uniref:hypothetical protein n=1 Tax=unclassified Streptomyces TaxID=2593676 RepID=UPI0033AE8A41
MKTDSNGTYDLNLAANEYMADGHTLDKHVGKTDERLAQRLRDQQSNGPTQAWPHGKPYFTLESLGYSPLGVFTEDCGLAIVSDTEVGLFWTFSD